MIQIRELVDELETLHGCHTFVLYGSHAHGTATPASDIDIVCFGPGPFEAEACDCRQWNGFWLDAWIYDQEAMTKPADFLHLAGGRVLKERDGLGSRLLEAVAAELEKPPVPAPAHLLQHRRAWIAKTLVRIRQGDPEAWFRRYCLCGEMLEFYYLLGGQRFPGFKQGMKALEAADPQLHALFVRLYGPEADLELIENIAAKVLEDKR